MGAVMTIYILASLIGAIWSANVASRKNLNVLGYTILGFLLPLIGVIAVMVAQPAEPRS